MVCTYRNDQNGEKCHNYLQYYFPYNWEPVALKYLRSLCGTEGNPPLSTSHMSSLFKA